MVEVCATCLYNKNCQFLAKHSSENMTGCTGFRSEADLRAEVAREIFEEVRKTLVFGADRMRVIAPQKKYMEEHYGATNGQNL